MSTNFLVELIEKRDKKYEIRRNWLLEGLRSLDIIQGTPDFWYKFWKLTENLDPEFVTDLTLIIDPTDGAYSEADLKARGNIGNSVSLYDSKLPEPAGNNKQELTLGAEDCIRAGASRRDADIWSRYNSVGNQKQIAADYGISDRQVQRILQATNNKLQTYLDNENQIIAVWNAEVARTFHKAYVEHRMEDGGIREAREVVEELGDFETNYRCYAAGGIDEDHIIATNRAGKKYTLTINNILALARALEFLDFTSNDTQVIFINNHGKISVQLKVYPNANLILRVNQNTLLEGRKLVATKLDRIPMGEEIVIKSNFEVMQP